MCVHFGMRFLLFSLAPFQGTASRAVSRVQCVYVDCAGHPVNLTNSLNPNVVPPNNVDKVSDHEVNTVLNSVQLQTTSANRTKVQRLNHESEALEYGGALHPIEIPFEARKNPKLWKNQLLVNSVL